MLLRSSPRGAYPYFFSSFIAQDYYPFGMLMPGRVYTSSDQEYRFGFNGKEEDNEVKGNGNSLDFGARIYDSRIARWMSGDPKSSKYPMDSPFMFAGNSPLVLIDPDGKEKLLVVGSENRTWNLTFVLPALKDFKAYFSKGESATVVLFTANYTNKQRNRIKNYVEKKGGTYIEVNSANELVNYINTKSVNEDLNCRKDDPVTQLNIFAHGLPNQIAFGYGQSSETENSYSFNSSHVNKLDPSAFSKDAECVSFACRTGASNDNNGNVDPLNSLAQKIADKTGMDVYALQKRSDYENILPPDNRSTKQKVLEKVGVSTGDTTYDSNGGSWDTDSAIDKTRYPTEGQTPNKSPGWTKFEKQVPKK